MGLSIVSADGEVTLFSGGYGGFMRLRYAVARLLGCYDEVHIAYSQPPRLSDEEPSPWEEEMREKMGLPKRLKNPFLPLAKKLEALKQARMFTFFLHSDCDGTFAVPAMMGYLSALKPLVTSEIKEFVEGLQYCIDHNVIAEFQ